MGDESEIESEIETPAEVLDAGEAKSNKDPRIRLSGPQVALVVHGDEMEVGRTLAGNNGDMEADDVMMGRYQQVAEGYHCESDVYVDAVSDPRFVN